ncbi:MAG: [NiFe] hydrogenase metallocenter assembly protein HypD, partial [uncultured Actinomycetospora sp.]
EVRRRVPRRRHGAVGGRPDRRAVRARPPLRLHGGLRRAHAHDLQARPRGPPARVGAARARTRVPGLRAPDGTGGRRDRDRAGTRRDHDRVRRHDARARRRRVVLRRQGRRGRHPDGLLAAGRIEDRAQPPGQARGVHGHRLRDHRALHGDDRPAGRARGDRELLDLLQPRHDHPGDQGHPRLPRPAPGRLPRPGARVHRDRVPALRVHRGPPRQTAGHRRLRAAGHPAVGAPADAPAARGPLRGREPVQPRRALERQPPGARGHRRGHGAPAVLRVARPRVHLAVRHADARGVRAVRRRADLPGPGGARRRPEGVPVRRGAQGRPRALGVQGLRHRVHPRDPDRHLHGVLGGRLRGLLQLRPLQPRTRPGRRHHDARGPGGAAM